MCLCTYIFIKISTNGDAYSSATPRHLCNSSNCICINPELFVHIARLFGDLVCCNKMLLVPNRKLPPNVEKKSEKLHNIFIWKCGRFQFRRLQFAFEFCQTHSHNIKRNHLQIEIFDTAVEHTVIFLNQKLKAKKKHLDRMFKNTLLTLFDFRENGNFTITSFSICVFVFCVCEFEMFVFMSLTFFVLLTKYLYYIDNENEFLFSDFFPLTFYSTIQTNDTENFQLFVSLYNWMANKIWMESRRTNEKQCR